MKLRLLLLLPTLLFVLKATAQFSGPFAPYKWEYKSTTYHGNGSVDTSGAPGSIVLTSSNVSGDFSSGKSDDWRISPFPASGLISFHYNHVNPDLPDDVDYAYYIINSDSTLITKNGSGDQAPFAIAAGDLFAFRIFNDESLGYQATLTISNFVFTPTSPLIKKQPKSISACPTSTAGFKLVAEATTSYQWQVKIGVAAYTNVVDGGIYSGATTDSLTLTGIPFSMNGNLYRCIATGSSNPKATSTAASLTVNSSAVSLSSQTNLTCNGAATGAATVLASGGTGTKTYSWAPSGGTAATATGLTAGTYTCTVTDNVSCAVKQTVTLTEPTAITATISSQTNVSCNGGTNGAVAISASGGTGTLTYSWAPAGGSAATASGLAANTYTVTITDANTCSVDKTIVITEPDALAATTSQTNVSCKGGANGEATVAATGGTSPYSYAWTLSGGTDATASGLAEGTYTCTITDGNSCFITKVLTITEPTAITASVSTQTNVTCNGNSNGAATISASGGTGTLTYAWAPTGGTDATATGLVAATYTCTITDANLCKQTQTVTITEPTAIAATLSQTNVSCKNGSNGSATVVATGGTGAYSYEWAPTGGTDATANGLSFGTYTVTIKDANLCSITKTVDITEPTAITATTTQTNISCNGGTNGSAAVVATGGTGAYTYNWAPSGGTAATATGLAAATYTVTSKDANLCSTTNTVTITEPVILSASSTQTNVLCNGSATGTAVVTAAGGTGAYSYSWLPSGGNADTAKALAAGTYTCTITDANMCATSKIVTLTEPLLLSATSSQTSVFCNGDSTGTATVIASGGTAAYTYSWSPYGGTAATAIGLAAGTYTCTITDANNCSHNEAITITELPGTVFTSSHSNVLCNGAADGSASVNVTSGAGPYTYAWSPLGGTAASATGLIAGTYTVTVTDANTCTKKGTITITQPDALTATMTSSNVRCTGASNGEAAVTPIGGTAPYTYTWNAPYTDTDSTLDHLDAGTYTCTVKDANNCATTAVAVIIEPAMLEATATHTNVSCFGGNNGTATVTATGGTINYSYAWSPIGGTAATATGLTVGSYTVTVRDTVGCSLTQKITITEPAKMLVIGSSSVLTCFGDSSTISINAIQGTPPYIGTGSFTRPGGIYTFIVADSNSCADSIKFTIVEPAAIVTLQTISICNGEKVVVGDSTYTKSGVYVNVLKTKQYSCDSTVTTNLTVNTLDLAVVVNNDTLSVGAVNGSYQWIDCSTGKSITGATLKNFTPIKSGIYAVIVTNVNCSDTSACTPISLSGIAKETSMLQLNVFPNPSAGTFTIRTTIAGSFTIINQLGQTVRSFELNNSNDHAVTISELSNGTYYIIGLNHNYLTRQKIVVVQ